MPDPIAESTLAGFLDALASQSPTPGGGAVAGVIGATAAALGEMVAGYSIGRSDDPSVDQSIESIRGELANARRLFLTLSDEDASAYAVLNAAFKLPKSDLLRAAAILDGAGAAIQPPLAALALAGDVSRLLEQLQPNANPNLGSDLAIAARLASTTADSALWNVKANAPMLGEQGQQMLAEASILAEAIGKRTETIEKSC